MLFAGFLAGISTEDVRAGASKSVLEATFDANCLPETAIQAMAEWQIDLEEGSLILRREIYSSGKSRSLINNCSVTLQQMRQLAPYLVDIFGQNEHQSLLDSDSQQELYDGSIGIGNGSRNCPEFLPPSSNSK
jgi:DNA repair protein RecN (Recombination protein N)